MKIANFKQRQRGQALIMTTFAAILIFGMLGLTVDLGWAYFERKSAQSAADAAALAAAQAARAGVSSDDLQCGVEGVECAASPMPCSSISGGSLQAACTYAARLGFPLDDPRSLVTVQASDRNTAPTVVEACGQGGATVRHAPTAGCVDNFYWVTTRVTRRIPQLFSAILGNTEAVAGARATAAFSDSVPWGNLWGLNRQFETPVVGRGEQGNDIYVWGDSSLIAGGIILASSSTGAGHTDETAVVGGSGSVIAETMIRGAGAADDVSKFDPPPENGFPDLPAFNDPMSGKGQPPAPPAGLDEFQLLNGTLAGDCDNPPTYPPGSYYAVRKNCPTCPMVATGGPITISGCVTFSAGPGGFGNYVFFGGLNVGPNVVTFHPGRYFLAGSTTGEILTLPNNAVMQDNTPLIGENSVRNSDAGEIFVFTDANYPGLHVPSMVEPVRNTLDFGGIHVQSGNDIEMNLHGLNADHIALPEELKTFAPTVFWQDQRNSPVLYDEHGYVDYTSCGDGHTLDNPCTNPDRTIEPGMIFQASPKLQLYGLFYQPRGAGVEFQGHGHMRTPLQIITGSVSLQGGNTVELVSVQNPLRRRVIALVE